MDHPQPAYPAPVPASEPENRETDQSYGSAPEPYPAPAPVHVAPPVDYIDPGQVTAPPLPPTPHPVATSPYATPEAPPAPIAPPVPAPHDVIAPETYSPPDAPAPVVPHQGLGFQEPVFQQETSNDVHVMKEALPEIGDRPRIERLLTGLVRAGGSDLHLVHEQPPRYRVAGELLPVGGEARLHSNEIEAMVKEILSDHAWEEFKRTNDADSSYAMHVDEGAAVTSRYRVNVFRSMGAGGLVIRVIPSKIVTLSELGLLPQIANLAKLPRGLVLFCGPTGSGKSTSMAALVDEINSTRSERIFTLEDPVEFVHTSKKCLVSHREIGEDTASFEEGLRRVRRQDPDVILVGEMRDYTTIASAIEAADTGHLVIATLHTNSAPETISRIVNSFPGSTQDQIRTTLSSTLKAVICQTLVPSPKAAKGRVVATEIMLVDGAISANIRKNDIKAIEGSLVDRSSGNLSLDAHLSILMDQGLITKKEALKKASSPRAFEQMTGRSA